MTMAEAYRNIAASQDRQRTPSRPSHLAQHAGVHEPGSKVQPGADGDVEPAVRVADIVVLGYQNHRGSVVVERIIRQHPTYSIVVVGPP